MKLKRFDLLFVKGENPVARVVEGVTHSQYSHVAIVLDEWHLAETDWQYPLRISHISDYPARMYDVYRFYRAFTDEEICAMNAFLHESFGTPYDLWESVTNGLHIKFGWKIYGSDKRMNCVESAVNLFKAGGIELGVGDMTPGCLSNNNFLLKQ